MKICRRRFQKAQFGHTELVLELLAGLLVEQFIISYMSIVKTRQTDWWHHLLVISCNEQGMGGVPCWRQWGAVQMSHWMQNSTNGCCCLSSFNYRLTQDRNQIKRQPHLYKPNYCFYLAF